MARGREDGQSGKRREMRMERWGEADEGRDERERERTGGNEKRKDGALQDAPLLKAVSHQQSDGAVPMLRKFTQ